MDAGKGLINKLQSISNLVVNGEKLANEVIEIRCERGAEIAIRLGFNTTMADGIRYLDEHWNGTGRPYKIVGKKIPVRSRIALLTQVVDVFFQVGGQRASEAELRKRRGTSVADIFDAITATRPYRGPIPVEKAIEIMRSEAGSAIDESVLNALITRLPGFDIP